MLFEERQIGLTCNQCFVPNHNMSSINTTFKLCAC